MTPETGTFVSRDTYSGNTNSPVTLHKYLYANANPVTYSDPSGYCGVIVEAKYVAEVAVIGFSFILMATALVGAINSMSGVMTNVITGIVDGIGSMVDSIATGIQDSAEMIESLRDQIAKEVYDLVQGLLEGTETVKDFGQGKHTVYVLIDKNTGNGEYSFTIKYVGRTVNESKREAAHKRNTEKKDYEFRAIYRGLSRNNARIFEQALISTFILGKCGGALVNKIRGIAVNKLVNFDLSSICNFYNRMENEMLDLMGQ